MVMVAGLAAVAPWTKPASGRTRMNDAESDRTRLPCRVMAASGGSSWGRAVTDNTEFNPCEDRPEIKRRQHDYTA